MSDRKQAFDFLVQQAQQAIKDHAAGDLADRGAVARGALIGKMTGAINAETARMRAEESNGKAGAPRKLKAA